MIKISISSKTGHSTLVLSTIDLYGCGLSAFIKDRLIWSDQWHTGSSFYMTCCLKIKQLILASSCSPIPDFLNQSILTLYGLSKTAEQRTTIQQCGDSTLAIDGWGVTFGTARRGLGGLWPRPVPLAVPNITAHPSRPVYQLHIS